MHDLTDTETAQEKRARKPRYSASPDAAGPPVALTPARLEVLRFVALCGVLSLADISLLACEREGRSKEAREKAARRLCRPLLDAGWVRALCVPRAALAPPGAADDPSLAFGSAANLYVLTRDGHRALARAGLLPREAEDHRPPDFGPRGTLMFLSHYLSVQAAFVYFQRCADASGGRVLRWLHGAAAALDLPPGGSGPKRLLPDAWISCRFPSGRLYAFIESDQGTERGGERWRGKIAAYGAAFGGADDGPDGPLSSAKVIVTAPSAARRDGLAAFVAGSGAPKPLQSRFLFADSADLAVPDLSRQVWRSPGSSEVEALVPGSGTGQGGIPSMRD